MECPVTIRYKFEIPTEREARDFLRRSPATAENHGDRLLCQRRLLPVTTEAERAEVAAYIAVKQDVPINRSSGSPRASRRATNQPLSDSAARNVDNRSVWAHDGHAGAQVVAQHRETQVETCRPRLRPSFGGAA